MADKGKMNEFENNNISKMEEGGCSSSNRGHFDCCTSTEVVAMAQKVIAEIIGTYFLVFAGCSSVAINKLYDDAITFPGICVTWGLVVMVMVYSVGHISGAHFNPAVTIAFAVFRRFPIWQVPLYIIAQVIGSILASATISIMFEVTREAYFGTVPSGSVGQSFVMEIILTFLLMFVISGVATDNRAIGQMAGIAIGMTIMIDLFIGGPVSGASMNPARSLGPAIVRNVYTSLWVYIFGPVIGALTGGFAYNLIRFTDKPLSELAKAPSLVKSSSSFIRSISTKQPSIVV